MPDFISAIELIAEQRIREALERGEFEDLPGAGRPLEFEDLSNVPEDLRMAYKILKNSGCLPEELAERREIINLTNLLDSCEEENERLAAMRKLRRLIEKSGLGRSRLAALEGNEEYFQKALARLARYGG